MDDFKGDGDNEGLNYVFLGDSGVIHVGKPTGWEEKSDLKPSREAKEEVERLLQMSEMIRTRMEIRNSLRGWIEKIPCLADMLGIPSLPKMSAQEVYDEHKAFVDRKLGRSAFTEEGKYPAESLLILQEDWSHDKDEKTLKIEERAKQMAYKFKWQIKHYGYKEAASYIKWMLAATEDERQKGAISEAVRLVAGKVLADLIRDRKADEAVKAFFELGAVCFFEREDLFDVKDSELRSPAMKKAFVRELAKMVDYDPAMVPYTVVRDHVSDMGIMDAKEADESPEVAVAVESLLKRSLKEHEIYFRWVLDSVKEAGFEEVAAGEIRSCRTVFMARLVKKMREAPEYFAVMRDRWVAWGLIEADATDNNREIEMLFSDHLQRCFEKDPFLYSKMKYHWRKSGLLEKKGEEKGRALAANWAVKSEFEVQDTAADRLMKSFEEEKALGERLIAQEDMEETMNATRFRLFSKAKREEFECRYPQYAGIVPENDV
jgi:hypothetical protein